MLKDSISPCMDLYLSQMSVPSHHITHVICSTETCRERMSDATARYAWDVVVHCEG